ncbi:MAG: fructokinase [Anaerolineae bacterium]|nr:fructokinase [Anaerolineae bacterium]
MVDVITFGELLIDFVSTVSGVSLVEAPGFEKAAGGAPANVAVGLARLGVSSGFMGKVGDDDFGRFLAQTLAENGVDTSALLFSDEARTALAFVSLKEDGERDFMFYRHPSADMLIRPEEIDHDYIGSAKVFHYGSISLISEPSRSATLAAIESAREHGLLISYDPNLRLSLWPSPAEARRGIELGWGFADVIKISEDELEFLTGTQDLERGADEVFHPELKLLVISRGREGCYFATRERRGYVPGYRVAAVDTTGAGDGFVAGLLSGLLDIGFQLDSAKTLTDVLRLANAVGALTTTKRGAIPALPTREEVLRFIETSSVKKVRASGR